MVILMQAMSASVMRGGFAMGAAHRRPEPLHLWVQGPGAASLSLSTQFFSCEFRNNLKFKVHVIVTVTLTDTHVIGDSTVHRIRDPSTPQLA